MMNQNTATFSLDRNIAWAYLLGTITPAHRDLLEDRLTIDPHFGDEIAEFEDDFILDYLTHSLSPDDVKLFEDQYLINERRMEKFEFSKAILLESGSNEPAIAVRTSLLDPLSAFFSLRVGLVTAAILIGVIAIAYYITRQEMPVVEVVQVSPEDSKANIPTSSYASPSRPPTSTTPEMRIASDQKHGDPAPDKRASTFKREEKPKLPSTISRVLAITLFPNTRSKSGKNIITPTNQTETVQFTIPIAKGDEFRSYLIEVSDISGKKVFEAVRERRGSKVSFSLPIARLAAGRYEVSLKGSNANELPVNLDFYSFEITPIAALKN